MLLLIGSSGPAIAQSLRSVETLIQAPEVTDWLVPTDPREVRPYPFNGARPAQNPPSFRWRLVDPDDVYEVVIRQPDGSEIRRTTRSNFLNLDMPLPVGTYAWQVRRWPSFAGAEQWSKERGFELLPDARGAPPASPRLAFERAANAPRPRLLPREPFRSLLLADAYVGWKRRFFDILEARQRSAPPLPDTETRLSGGNLRNLDREDLVMFRRAVRGNVRRVMRVLYDAMVVRIVTRGWSGDAQALTQSLDAVRWLVALDPRGETSNEAEDLLNLRIAKALAVALDTLHDDMDPRLRLDVIRTIEDRTQQAFDAYVLHNIRALAAYPYNSHGYRHAVSILAISTLLAGDSPRAVAWFRTLYPLFLGLGNPWGGDDGGYANGVNYGVWELLSNAQQWDTIRGTTDVDYFDTAWARGQGLFLSYVVPPGAPNSGFGDGGEEYRPLVWAETARLLFERTRLPVAGRLFARWQQFIRDSDFSEADMDEEVTGWTILLGSSLPPAPLSTIASESTHLPDSAIFPSIGWSVMHSDIDSPDRYSILFKSSPYGSFSHSHADQNSFIINGLREAIAIDSGYYDTHKSRHHLAWTTRTEAHNAITFDGGKGQPWDDLEAQGRLTLFARCPDFDAVAGDATAAYRGQLGDARRTLLYLRPGQVLIHDRLASDTPRRFEWNIHALRRMQMDATGTLRLAMNRGSVCIRRLAGPDADFTQTDAFPVDPDPRLQPDWTPQWHGRFTMMSPVNATSWLYLVSLDCTAADVRDVRTLASGDMALVLDGHDIRIGPTTALAVPRDTLFDPQACSVPPSGLEFQKVEVATAPPPAEERLRTERAIGRLRSTPAYVIEAPR
ncbi:MAG: heparinase II/III family protein [Pseudomonadota bacterium]|nr:heparinase II/III family protein [Pseudomonadota bacterium]